MELQVSLPHSQVPAACSYPQPPPSSQCSIPIICISILILPSILSPGISNWPIFLRLPEQHHVRYTPLLSPIRCIYLAQNFFIDLINRKIFSEIYISLRSSLMQFPPLSCYLVPIRLKYFP